MMIGTVMVMIWGLPGAGPGAGKWQLALHVEARPSRPFSLLTPGNAGQGNMTACLFELQTGRLIRERVIAHPCWGTLARH